jgi:nitroreductase
MNVIEALNERFSSRAYKPDPVSRETLDKVMEAALRAPSWANTQPWEIYVAAGDALNKLRAAFAEQVSQGVSSNPDIARPTSWPDSIRQRMAGPRPTPAPAAPAAPAPAAAPQSEEERVRGMMQRQASFFGAPVAIYLCMDKTLTPYSIYDLGLISQSICLAAKEYGLDTVIAVNLVGYPEVLRKELGISDSLQIVMGIALGYADLQAQANQRPKSTRRTLSDAVHYHGV